MEIWEISISFAIGLLTGIISGCLTGVIVTRYYRKKDEKNRSVEEKYAAMSEFASYLKDIMAELEIIEKAEYKMYESLQRLLKKKRIRQEILRIVVMDKEPDVFFEISFVLENLERKCEQKDVDILEFKKQIGEISMLLI